MFSPASTRISPSRPKTAAPGFILAGDNYGQGSSREHAALAPMHLGIKAVFAKSFARIHRSNLINFGILPIVIDEKGYGLIEKGTAVSIKNIHAGLSRSSPIEVSIINAGKHLNCSLTLSERESEILMEGGLLNFINRKVRG